MDISSVADAEVQRLMRMLERYRLRAVFLDITSDIEVPACACAIIDERTSEPIVALGAGAGFNIAQNIIAGIWEALSIHARIAGEEKWELPEEYVPFSSDPPVTKIRRLVAWRGKRMLERFSFFISGKPVPIAHTRYARAARTFDAAARELDFVLDMFREKGKGYEVYCHAVRHPVLRAVGYHVVKVLVPRLLPIYLTEHVAPLDSVRLREVPRALGYGEAKLNPWPHPFP
jgi:ribosomal protein S12 methylthiotransferase accessory factor YcaO